MRPSKRTQVGRRLPIFDKRHCGVKHAYKYAKKGGKKKITNIMKFTKGGGQIARKKKGGEKKRGEHSLPEGVGLWGGRNGFGREESARGVGGRSCAKRGKRSGATRRYKTHW